MKRVQKILALLLTATTVFSLAGCGASTAEQTADDAETVAAEEEAEKTEPVVYSTLD